MNRRKIIYPLVLILTSIAVITISSLLRPHDEDVSATTDNYDRFGLAAAWEYINISDADGVILEDRYDTLSDSALLIIAAPQGFRGDEKETSGLIDWVGKGNNVVILSSTGLLTGKEPRHGKYYSTALEDYLGIDEDFATRKGMVKLHRIAVPKLTVPYSERSKPVVFRHWYNKYYTCRYGNVIPLYTEENDPEHGIIFEGRFGKGRILFLPSTYPFTNEGLRLEDNARFFLNTIAELTVDRRIIFDHYHHTFTGSDFTLSSLQRQRIWYMILILFSAFVFLLVSGYSRFGPIYSLEPEKRVSVKSYIFSLGDLYRRSSKGRQIAEDMHEMFLKDVCRRFGVRYTTNSRQILDAIHLRSKEFHGMLLSLEEQMRDLRASYTSRKLLEYEKSLAKASRAMGINT